MKAAVCLLFQVMRIRVLDDPEFATDKSFVGLDLDAFFAVEATAVHTFLSSRSVDLGAFTPDSEFPETLSDWKDGASKDDIVKEWERRFKASTLVTSTGISAYAARYREEEQERLAQEKTLAKEKAQAVAAKVKEAKAKAKALAASQAKADKTLQQTTGGGDKRPRGQGTGTGTGTRKKLKAGDPKALSYPLQGKSVYMHAQRLSTEPEKITFDVMDLEIKYLLESEGEFTYSPALHAYFVQNFKVAKDKCAGGKAPAALKENWEKLKALFESKKGDYLAAKAKSGASPAKKKAHPKRSVPVRAPKTSWKMCLAPTATTAVDEEDEEGEEGEEDEEDELKATDEDTDDEDDVDYTPGQPDWGAVLAQVVPALKEAIGKIDVSAIAEGAKQAKDKIDALKEEIGKIDVSSIAEGAKQAKDTMESAARAFPSDEAARNRIQELERALAEERDAHIKAREDAATMKVKLAESSAALATGAFKVSTLAAQIASFVDAKKDLMRLVATLKAMSAAEGSLYSDLELKMIIHNCLLVPAHDKEEVLAKTFGSA